MSNNLEGLSEIYENVELQGYRFITQYNKIKYLVFNSCSFVMW